MLGGSTCDEIGRRKKTNHTQCGREQEAQIIEHAARRGRGEKEDMRSFRQSEEI